MNEDHRKHDELLTTTDCLEAVGAFKAMKNFLFVIIVLCLLLLQISFWLVNRNRVRVNDKSAEKVASMHLEIPLGLAFSLTAPVQTAVEPAEDKDINEVAKEA